MIKANKGRTTIKGKNIPEILTDFANVCMGVNDTLVRCGVEKEFRKKLMDECYAIGQCDTSEERMEHLKKNA